MPRALRCSLPVWARSLTAELAARAWSAVQCQERAGDAGAIASRLLGAARIPSCGLRID